MTKINYLHLSDLHLGDKHQKGLMSQTKKILFEDISHILRKIETLDVVFFTGDLVQTGTKEEFIQLEEFLIQLWNLFKDNGQNPYLLCVPGNHDLNRIMDQHNPYQRIMSNWPNEDIKDEYFWNNPNDYHNFIVERFKNYTDWYNNTSIRKPEKISWGYLPGDFHCSILIKEKKLGVVGLNSSFLQLYAGDAKKKIGIYHNQITHLFGENYCDWLVSQDLSILLTHHSPDWFETNSSKEFHQEIYIEDSFMEHLCGHMHEPSCTSMSINGFPSKNLFISPSLFGLEYYGSKLNSERIHGYTAGFYSIESNKITKTVWPRISFRTSSRVLKLSQNEDFNLDKETSSFTKTLKTFQNLEQEIETNDTIKEFQEKGENLFAKETIRDRGLARSIYKQSFSHLSVRFQERNKAQKNLINYKNCWIVTKFGLGEDEFIGSLLNEVDIDPGNCFCINCDNISTVDELIEAFKSTFSQDITKFCDTINTLHNPLLVFSKLDEEITRSAGTLKELIQTIFDFSSKLKILLVSETPPDNRIFDYVELFPLDTPGVKQYVENSKELNTTFTIHEYDKIHRISSGIPLYIDKVIEQLGFLPLSELGDLEFDGSPYNDKENTLSKAQKKEIDLIKSDDSKQGIRKFTLLAILALLHNGETFERIRRFNPALPFHADDISYLIKNKLIETVQVNSIFEEEQKDSSLVKIIRIPRITRDYISSLLLDKEKLELYKQACHLYLGRNWRNSIKIIKTKDVELDVIIHQNLQIAIRFILSHGIESDDKIEISRMTRVSILLIEYFSNRGAYKDAIYLTEEILLLIKDIEFDDSENTRTYLMRRLGQNLRMTSIHDRSIEILKSIVDDENNSISNTDRNGIRLSLAYAFESLNKKEETIKYADLIKKNEKDKNSHLYLSADYIITKFITDNKERIQKLNTLKNKAKKYKHNNLKANIILDLCRISNNTNQIKHLDKIISETKDSTYNKIRALAAKAEIILTNKKTNEITTEDLLGLHIAYSYSFYQRFQYLLNKCHMLAWQYWYEQNRFDQLLNLFRYSSFLWRLCGSTDLEQKYIDILHSNTAFIEWFNQNKYGVSSSYYEQRIFALYNKGKSQEVLQLKE